MKLIYLKSYLGKAHNQAWPNKYLCFCPKQVPKGPLWEWERYHSGGRVGRLKHIPDTSLGPLWCGHSGTHKEFCLSVMMARTDGRSS